MISYKIIFSKKALKFSEKNKQIAKRFYDVFNDISNNLQNVKKYDIKKLVNHPAYRLRISKYRAIFSINDEKITIFVIDINSRGDIYK